VKGARYRRGFRALYIAGTPREVSAQSMVRHTDQTKTKEPPKTLGLRTSRLLSH